MVLVVLEVKVVFGVVVVFVVCEVKDVVDEVIGVVVGVIVAVVFVVDIESLQVAKELQKLHPPSMVAVAPNP